MRTINQFTNKASVDRTRRYELSNVVNEIIRDKEKARRAKRNVTGEK
jgi:hypothetical protein